MIRELVFPPRLRLQLESEARAAFPRECCGLIEGIRDCSMVEITFLHPTSNLRAENDRFEIDPAAQFRQIKAARARGADIVGCYHSHPNGKAEPSALDLAGGGEENFLWVIAGLTACQSDVTVAPFVFVKSRFVPVMLAV